MTWTYGAAFYVYEDGALSWLGIPGAKRHDMTWIPMDGWMNGWMDGWMDTVLPPLFV